MSDFLVEQQTGVLKVTINHPERGNAMTDDMAAELTRIIVAAAKTASVMVLGGAGEDFCVGRARGPHTRCVEYPVSAALRAGGLLCGDSSVLRATRGNAGAWGARACGEPGVTLSLGTNCSRRRRGPR